MSRAFLDDPERVAQLHALLDQGAKLDELVRELGVSQDTISRARRALGRPGWSKCQAERIVAMREAGQTYAEIRSELGVSVQTVWRALKQVGKVKEYTPRKK